MQIQKKKFKLEREVTFVTNKPGNLIAYVFK